MSALALSADKIVSLFHSHFPEASQPQIYRAPGRVNLIGEHTDYNLGFVLPIAIEMACYVAIAPAQHEFLRIYSREMNEESVLRVREHARQSASGPCSDYLIGIAREFDLDGLALKLGDVYVVSDVP